MGQPYLTDVFVELHVPDFDMVKDFYGKLGFKVVWEKLPHKQDGYLVMKKGKSLLGFYCGNEQVAEHSYFKKFPKTTPRGYGVEITLPIKNIDAYYQKVSQKIDGKYIVRPLTASHYDQHPKLNFRLIDPFGYYLHFSAPMNMLYKD